MAKADLNSKDSVLRELNDRPSELTAALDVAQTELEAPRKKRQVESTVLQLNCWSGGSNAVSSACWNGNRVVRLKLPALRARRRCAQRQRSRLTARAVGCPLAVTGDYLVG
jgi:hypothetical protein